MRRLVGLLVAVAVLLGGAFGSARAQSSIGLYAGSGQLQLGDLVFTVSSCTLSGLAGSPSCQDLGLDLVANGSQLVIQNGDGSSAIFAALCATGSCEAPDIQVNLDMAALASHVTLTSVTEGISGHYSGGDTASAPYAFYAGETVVWPGGNSASLPTSDLSTTPRSLALTNIPIPGIDCFANNTCIQLQKDAGIDDLFAGSGSDMYLDTITQNFTTGVPEPGSTSLLAFALLALAMTRLRLHRH